MRKLKELLVTAYTAWQEKWHEEAEKTAARKLEELPKNPTSAWE